MAYNRITYDKIAKQALDEIIHARLYKQGKIKNWALNESMYYGVKPKTTESRANVSLGRMQEFVHTLLSKIDNPLIFKYVKRKNSQLKRVERLNAIRTNDQNVDNWDIKDIVGKKQAIIYGRAIYSYYADSIDKVYQAHLEPIDVYNFLIDPTAGGIDIEQAYYLGDYSVIKSRKELEDGAKAGIYDRVLVKELLAGSGNADDSNQETTNQRNRSYDQQTLAQKSDNNPTKFKFWRWFTTYQGDGERYYILMDNSGRYIKCEKLVDIFPPTKDFPSGAWPYWTWAAFLDMTEFWTPSFCDYAREIFMAQDVSINQMLDNAEAINKPQRVVNVSAFENLAELKYRRDGLIKVKKDFDVDKAYQTITTPSINTPIQVFNILENIQQKASGVTEQTAGVADTSGRVAIYEGNQVAEADRFGLLNKSYAFGYKRFSKLHEMGVRNHLIKKVAVDIIGPNGVEIEQVKRSDVFTKNDEYSVIIEASNAQYLTSMEEKKTKVQFLQGQALNTLINQKKSFEIQSKIVGFDEDTVNQLLDVSFYGNSELMSECDRDIESLLENEDIKPNAAANNAYKQKIVTYLKDHEEDIDFNTFQRISEYIMKLEPIIMQNEAKALQDESNKMMNAGTDKMINSPAPNTPSKQKAGEILPQQPNGVEPNINQQ